MFSRGTTPLALVAVSALGAVALAGCGSDSSLPRVSSSATASPTTSTSRSTTASPTAEATVSTQADATPTTETPTTAASTSSTPASDAFNACGGGVQANQATSCAFALNVSRAYEFFKDQPGDVVTVSAVFSPATNSYYDMSCDRSSTPIRCTGGQGAVVLLP